METEQQIDRELKALRTRKKSHAKFIGLLVVLGVVLIASVAFGVLRRQTHDSALAASADEDAGRAPVVNVAPGFLVGQEYALIAISTLAMWCHRTMIRCCQS